MASVISRSVAAACVASLGFTALPAFAHIGIDMGGTHLSRYGDTVLKDAPCGRAGGTRGTHIYTYAPGEKITVTFKEYVPHPSYFRFAFDNDGDDDFREPASIKPIDPARPCPFNLADKCGSSDFYNNATVLPGMDNLEPHLAAASKGTYSFEVTLPDVECDNCTLQLIQVMQDTIHGAYNPTPGDPNDLPAYVADNYHECIDLVLKRPSGTGGSAGTAGNAGTGGTNTGSGGSGGTDTGCQCAVEQAPSSASFGALLSALGAGLVIMRRRRAR